MDADHEVGELLHPLGFALELTVDASMHRSLQVLTVCGAASTSLVAGRSGLVATFLRM